MKSFTIYGRPGCGFCYHALHLMQSHGFEFEYIDIYEQGLSKSEVSQRIDQPVSTMPQILHGDHYIGGCQELELYLRSAKFSQA